MNFTPDKLFIFEDSQTKAPHPFKLRDFLAIFPVQKLKLKVQSVRVNIGISDVNLEIHWMPHTLYK